MVGALATIIGGGMAVSMGASGSAEMVSPLIWLLVAYMGGTVGTGLLADHRNKPLNQWIEQQKSIRKKLVKKYNGVIYLLEQSYKNDKRELGFFSSGKKEVLREHYEGLYLRTVSDYKREKASIDAGESAEPVQISRFKRYWKIAITVGILIHVVGCGYTMGVLTQEMPEPATSARHTASATETEPTAWDAETVPMPHLTDGSRYVSNPDEVVTPHTEQMLNHWLKRLDDSLQVESAMIIVNHVKNEDVFTLAQELFDKYKIGKDDRGMVIVLAYGDHKVRTHTGRALEADLTDIECSRLQQTYAIPFMKEEQPDSGMLYLTEAIYNTLKKKDLPLTWEQQRESVIETLDGQLALLSLLFMVWPMIGFYLSRRYSGKTMGIALRSNPFAESPVLFIGSGGGGFRGGGGGGFGGGGFSGGFSGGSSGGGGATSSW